MYQYPFGIISGEGLGLTQSSLFRNGVVVPSRAIGQAKVKCYLNVANGNFIIVSPFINAEEMPGSVKLGLYYNQQAAQKWQISFSYLDVSQKSTLLILTEEDGHKTVYQYDAASLSYIEPACGPEGPAHISVDNQGQFFWYHPKSGRKRLYSPEGRIRSESDEAGRQFIYGYNEKMQPISITAPNSGNQYLIQYLTDVVTFSMKTPDDVVTLLQTHHFSNGLLQKTTIGADASQYTIEYSYVAGVMKSITQKDGTKVTLDFAYTAEKTHKMSRFILGENEIYDVQYNSPAQVVVGDSNLKQNITFTLDTAKRIVSYAKTNGTVHAPKDSTVTSFTYNRDGQVASMTLPNQGLIKYLYGVMKIRTVEDGPEEQHSVSLYSDKGAIQYASQFLKLDGLLPFRILTKFFVWDLSFGTGPLGRRLRFVLSPLGRVKEFRYDGFGNLISVRVYFKEFYDVSNHQPKKQMTLAKYNELRKMDLEKALATPDLADYLASNKPPSLEQMQQWASAYLSKYPKETSLKEYTVNDRGQIEDARVYSELDDKNEGIATGAGCEQYFRTYFGAVERSIKKQSETQKLHVNASYDMLQRRTLLIKAADDKDLKQQTKYVYRDNPTQTTHSVFSPNDRLECNAFNSSGYVVKKTEVNDMNTHAIMRVTEYKHDNHGRLVETITPDKSRHFQFYDRQNRLIYKLEPVEIDATGDMWFRVIEYEYDQENDCHSTIEYENKLSLNAITVGNPDLLPDANMVASLIKPNVLDRQTYTFLNKVKQPRFIVDAEEYVTEHRYDNLNRKIATIKYAKKLTEQIKDGKIPILTPNPDVDSYWQYFYDDDNKMIASQDPGGYVTEFKRGSAGRVTKKIIYDTKMPHNTDFSKVLPPVSPKDGHHYYYRNAKGQVIAEIDAENYMTIHTYFANNKKDMRRRYATKVTGDPAKIPDWQQLKPQESDEDQFSSWQYDVLEREIKNQSSWQIENDIVYNNMNSPTSTTHQDQTNIKEVRATYNRRNAWQEVEAKCDSLVAEEIIAICRNKNLTPEQKEQEINKIWETKSTRYELDSSGLKLYEMNSEDHKTYFYYNLARKPRFEIKQNGSILEYEYDTHQEVTVVRQYAAALLEAELQKLTGGFVTPALQKLIEALRDDAKDSVTRKEHNKRGEVIKITDPEEYVTTKEYNAFGKVSKEGLPLVSKQPTITKTYEYDVRENKIHETTTAGALTLEEHWTYDNPLGKEATYTNANKGTYVKTRDKLGRIIEETSPLNKTDHYTLDAFGRKIRHVNAEQEITEYDYNQTARTLTTKKVNAKGEVLAEWVTTYTAFHQDAVDADALDDATTKVYAPNGKLSSEINPLEIETQHNTFNLIGQTAIHKDGNGVITENTYDNADDLQTTTVDPKGLNLKTTYTRNAKGLPETIVDANGIIHKQTHDRRGLLLQEIVDPKTEENPDGANVITTYTYNGQGKKTSEVKGDATNATMFTTTFNKDELGRDIGKTKDPHNIDITNVDMLNAIGRIIRKTDPNGKITYYVFDEVGNKRFTLKPNNSVIQRTYDNVNREKTYRVYQQKIDLSLLMGKNIKEIEQILKPYEQPNDTFQIKFRDEAGRVAFTVNGLGEVTETLYDKASHEVGSYQYFDSVDPKNVSTVTIQDLRALRKDPDLDRVNYKVLDDASQERFAIDPDGYITEQLFNANGKVIAEIPYANKVDNPEAVAKLPPDQVATKIVKDPKRDRGSYKVFNAKDKPTFEVDPDSDEKGNPVWIVTKRVYDGNQNEIKTIIFAKKMVVPETYAELVTVLNGLKESVANGDRITVKQYDGANRNIATTDLTNDDGTGVTDHYQYNPQNKPTLHKDRATNDWENIYDTVGRLTHQKTPSVDITDTDFVAGKIQSTKTTAQVVRETVFDKASNEKKVVLASGSKNPRAVLFSYNDGNELTSTTVESVRVNDPTKHPTPTSRPETVQAVQNNIVHDAKGNKIVGENEKGILTFYVYDAQDRLRYEVDIKGGLIEHERNIFGNPIRVAKYDTPLDINLSKYETQGLTAELIEQHKKSSLYDQIDTLTYNRRGQVLTKHSAPALYYLATMDAVSQVNMAQAEIRYAYNAFGDVIYEAKLLDPKTQKYAETRKWYSRKGKEVAVSDKIQKVSLTYYNAFGEEETEYDYAVALASPPSASVTFSELLDLVKTDEKDREYRYVYNVLGQKAHIIIKNVVVSELILKGTHLPPVLQKSPPQDLTISFTYSAIGKQTSITYEDGVTAYFYYNARGHKIAETGVPRESFDEAGNSIIITPLTYFGINAHGKVVETTHFESGTKQARLTAVPVPIHEDPTKDQTTLKWHGNRGELLAEQDAEGNVKQHTYSHTGVPEREWHTLTNTKHGESTPHIDETLFTLDELDRAVFKAVYRDAYKQKTPTPVQTTATAYNTFSQPIFEGEGEGKWSVYWKYDVRGKVWSSNSDNGVPRLFLHDLAGNQTARLVSPTKDLAQVQYDEMSSVLLWEYEDLETTQIQHDAKGRMMANSAPFHYVDNPDALLNMPLNVIAGIDDPDFGKVSLTWERIANSSIGTKTELVLTPVTTPGKPAAHLTIEHHGKRSGVNVSTAVITGIYEYQIDFYVEDPHTKKLGDKPRYRACGKVQFKTGIDNDRTITMVPLVAEDQSHVTLTGKTKGLTKVDLWQGDNHINVITVTVDPNTQEALIDLSPYPSGQYHLVPNYGDSKGIATLPFTVYTNVPSPTPLGRRIPCTSSLTVDDKSGEFDWIVPLPFQQSYMQVVINYTDVNDQPQTHTQVIAPKAKQKATSHTITPNIQFQHAVKSVDDMSVSICIDAKWVPLMIQAPPNKSQTTAKEKKPRKAYVKQTSNAGASSATVEDEELDDWVMVESEPLKMKTYTFPSTTILYLSSIQGVETTDIFYYRDSSVGLHPPLRALHFHIVDAQAIAVDVTYVPSGVYEYDIAGQQGKFSLAAFGSQAFKSTPFTVKNEKILQNATNYYEYDVWDNQTQFIDANKARTNKTYTYKNKVETETQPLVDVTGTDGSVTRVRPVYVHGYNKRGVEIGVINPNNHVTGFVVNAAGQMVVKVLGDGTRVLQARAFNALNQLLHYQDSRGKTWTFVYNRLNKLIISYTPKKIKNIYTYNEVGNQTSYTDGCGNTLYELYDPLGNVQERVLTDGQTTLMTYDRNHQILEKKTVGESMLSYGRDYFGHPITRRDMANVDYTYHYDWKYQVIRMTSTDGDHGYLLPFNPFVNLKSFGKDTPIAVPPQYIEYFYIAGRKIEARDHGMNKNTIWNYDLVGRTTRMELRQRDGTLLDSVLTIYNSHGNELSTQGMLAQSLMGYDAAQNRRYAFYGVNVTQSDNSVTTKWDKLWFVYDDADRAITLGAKEKGRIAPVPGMGMTIGYQNNMRVQEGYYDKKEDNKWITKQLSYDNDSRLRTTESSNGDTSDRQYNDANLLIEYNESVIDTTLVASRRTFERTAHQTTNLKMTYNGNTWLSESNQRVKQLRDDKTEKDEQTITHIRAFTPVGLAATKTVYSKNLHVSVTDHLTAKYVYFDEPKLSVLAGKRHSEPGKNAATKYYDANGDTQSILMVDEGFGINRKMRANTIFMTTNADRHILIKWDGTLTIIAIPIKEMLDIKVTRYLLSASGELLGQFLSEYTIPFRHGKPTGPIPNFNVVTEREYLSRNIQSYIQPISEHYPPPTPPRIFTSTNDTFAKIAQRIYGDSRYAGLLAAKNDLPEGLVLRGGLTIKIPQMIPSRNTAGDAEPYFQFIGIIIPAMYPHFKVPQPKPPHHHHSFLADIIEVLAVVIVTVAVVTVMQGASPILVGMVSGALSDAVAQGVAIGFGEQRKFKPGEVAEAAVGGAVSGAVAGISGNFGVIAVKAAAVNIGLQLAEMAVGLRKKFDISQVVSAAITAGMNAKLNGGKLKLWEQDILEDVTSTFVSDAITGTPLNVTSLAENIVESTVIGDVQAHINIARAKTRMIIAREGADTSINAALLTAGTSSSSGGGNHLSPYDRNVLASTHMNTGSWASTGRGAVKNPNIGTSPSQNAMDQFMAKQERLDAIRKTQSLQSQMKANQQAYLQTRGFSSWSDEAAFNPYVSSPQWMHQYARHMSMTSTKIDDAWHEVAPPVVNNPVRHSTQTVSNSGLSHFLWQHQDEWWDKAILGTMHGINSVFYPVAGGNSIGAGMTDGLMAMDPFADAREISTGRVPITGDYVSRSEAALNLGLSALSFADGGAPELIGKGIAFFDGKVVGAVEREMGKVVNRFGLFGKSGAESSTNPLLKALNEAKPTPGTTNQLETTLSDGTKVIFRRDVGEHAHPIGKEYQEPVDHYNIEVHSPSETRLGKFKSVQNAHIILDKSLRPVDIILKNKNYIRNTFGR